MIRSVLRQIKNAWYWQLMTWEAQAANKGNPPTRSRCLTLWIENQEAAKRKVTALSKTDPPTPWYNEDTGRFYWDTRDHKGTAMLFVVDQQKKTSPLDIC
ncbi:hypothetical protein [Desulfobacula toluolica]|uniref:Uncharacterized protein n=1 Tax=Desulfobacula toluolica (strain DSM 7467 / Tol2) TaxID=651182 RepID=K0NCW5_DESTT|nr:hypothetical protein [Desulfobacula toluolica]CCK82419.1 uncharacterized protein TOL2_C42630 [Desulfobacula toluolica Tol2]